jgi:hypothetical protein
MRSNGLVTIRLKPYDPTDSIQPCPQVVVRQAETDAEMVIQAKVVARYD